MEKYIMSEEERTYLSGYDINAFELLLIRRGSFPYKNAWALPGGFCHKGESVSETAARELLEETGVENAYLRPFAIFSEEGQDLRGWIISHAYLALQKEADNDGKIIFENI